MSPIRKRSNDDGTGRRIAYVMTHYPYPSQTFLMEEVLGVEGDGLHVAPIAINPAAESDMLTDELRPRARSHVLRQAVVAAARLRHRPPRCAPSGPARRRVPRAMRSAGADLRLALGGRSMSPKASWSGTTAGAGISHPHAQFGGMPAAVAMYAAEVAPVWTVGTTSPGATPSTATTTSPTSARSAWIEDCFGVDGRVHLGLHRIAGHAAGVTEDWPKVHVVRCGIALDRFPMRPPPVGERPVVLTVGRLSTEKGQLVLLHAMRLLADAAGRSSCA